jgi:hypothetical protein
MVAVGKPATQAGIPGPDEFTSSGYTLLGMTLQPRLASSAV